MATDSSGDGVPAPAVFAPGVRCALEMAMVGLIVALIGLPAESSLVRGLVLIVAFVAMVVVLFWALNRQMAEWVRRVEGRPTFADDEDVF